MPLRQPYACFQCCKVFKQTRFYELPEDVRPVSPAERVVPCPECGEPMADMGLDFKMPRKQDVRQWRKVEILCRHGVTFHTCGCGAGYRPSTVCEVGPFLAERDKQRQSEGERLVARFTRIQRGSTRRRR